MQELKRTIDGARFFEDNDSYAFFKLALQEHEYLPPAISSAAVARARNDFEGLRQKSEDSITDHISEFRRLYESLLKARGPDGGTPYIRTWTSICATFYSTVCTDRYGED